MIKTAIFGPKHVTLIFWDSDETPVPNTLNTSKLY